MNSRVSREIEGALNSLLTKTETSSVRVNICASEDIEDFFRLQRDGVCRYFLRNECRKGDTCEFKHEEDHIQANYKTKLCKNYSERGFCKYKDQCSYAHGERELQGQDRGRNGRYPRGPSSDS